MSPEEKIVIDQHQIRIEGKEAKQFSAKELEGLLQNNILSDDEQQYVQYLLVYQYSKTTFFSKSKFKNAVDYLQRLVFTTEEESDDLQLNLNNIPSEYQIDWVAFAERCNDAQLKNIAENLSVALSSMQGQSKQAQKQIRRLDKYITKETEEKNEGKVTTIDRRKKQRVAVIETEDDSTIEKTREEYDKLYPEFLKLSEEATAVYKELEELYEPNKKVAKRIAEINLDLLTMTTLIHQRPDWGILQSKYKTLLEKNNSLKLLNLKAEYLKQLYQYNALIQSIQEAKKHIPELEINTSIASLEPMDEELFLTSTDPTEIRNAINKIEALLNEHRNEINKLEAKLESKRKAQKNTLIEKIQAHIEENINLEQLFNIFNEETLEKILKTRYAQKVSKPDGFTQLQDMKEVIPERLQTLIKSKTPRIIKTIEEMEKLKADKIEKINRETSLEKLDAIEKEFVASFNEKVTVLKKYIQDFIETIINLNNDTIDQSITQLRNKNTILTEDDIQFFEKKVNQIADNYKRKYSSISTNELKKDKLEILHYTIPLIARHQHDFQDEISEITHQIDEREQARKQMKTFNETCRQATSRINQLVNSSKNLTQEDKKDLINTFDEQLKVLLVSYQENKTPASKVEWINKNQNKLTELESSFKNKEIASRKAERTSEISNQFDQFKTHATPVLSQFSDAISLIQKNNSTENQSDVKKLLKLKNEIDTFLNFLSSPEQNKHHSNDLTLLNEKIDQFNNLLLQKKFILENLAPIKTKQQNQYNAYLKQTAKLLNDENNIDKDITQTYNDTIKSLHRLLRYFYKLDKKSLSQLEKKKLRPKRFFNLRQRKKEDKRKVALEIMGSLKFLLDTYESRVKSSQASPLSPISDSRTARLKHFAKRFFSRKKDADNLADRMLDLFDTFNKTINTSPEDKKEMMTLLYITHALTDDNAHEFNQAKHSRRQKVVIRYFNRIRRNFSRRLQSGQKKHNEVNGKLLQLNQHIQQYQTMQSDLTTLDQTYQAIEKISKDAKFILGLPEHQADVSQAKTMVSST